MARPPRRCPRPSTRGSPWELGISEAQQTLLINNLRNRVILRTDGGLRTGKDIVIAAILGAEEYNFGTIAMIAMGCVYVRKCHLNNCPVGVATTDPKWRSKFKGTPEMVVNFLNGVAQEAREIMAELGVRKLDELIGHPGFLKQRNVPDHPKANTVDLSPVLKDVVPELAKTQDAGEPEIQRICTQKRNDGIAKPALDLQILADLKKVMEVEADAVASEIEYGVEAYDEKAMEAISLLPDRAAVELSYDVVNTDRNIGTRLSGRIAEVHGNYGFNGHTAVTLKLNGTAGQSLGCFLVSGVAIDLVGEANDYVGKGMAAGEIVVRPPSDSKFEAAKNSIAGNTCLYGATGGKIVPQRPGWRALLCPELRCHRGRRRRRRSRLRIHDQRQRRDPRTHRKELRGRHVRRHRLRLRRRRPLLLPGEPRDGGRPAGHTEAGHRGTSRPPRRTRRQDQQPPRHSPARRLERELGEIRAGDCQGTCRPRGRGVRTRGRFGP